MVDEKILNLVDFPTSKSMSDEMQKFLISLRYSGLNDFDATFRTVQMMVWFATRSILLIEQCEARIKTLEDRLPDDAQTDFT